MSATSPPRGADLGELQRAAKALLRWGVVMDGRPDGEALRLIRRHEQWLVERFATLAGYHVEVWPFAARLGRRFDQIDDTPVFRTPTDRPFDRERYALVALCLAVLEQLGSQTSLSDLAIGVRRAAAGVPGLRFDPDQYASRQALHHAVRALQQWGALQLTDGRLEAWESNRGEAEALLDIDHRRCRLLFHGARGLHGRGGSRAMLHADAEAETVGRDTIRQQRRRRLARLLLERPVVYFADLSDEDVAYLRREAASLGAELEALTGATLERRREGVALIEDGRQFSDLCFPSGGGEQQAALLLLDRLCADADGQRRVQVATCDEASQRRGATLDACAPDAVGATRWQPPVMAPMEAPFFADAALEVLAAEICATHGSHLRADHAAAPARLLHDALALLAAFDLVRALPGGVCVMPALARYRDPVVRRADAAAAPQLTLFGAEA